MCCFNKPFIRCCDYSQQIYIGNRSEFTSLILTNSAHAHDTFFETYSAWLSLTYAVNPVETSLRESN